MIKITFSLKIIYCFSIFYFFEMLHFSFIRKWIIYFQNKFCKTSLVVVVLMKWWVKIWFHHQFWLWCEKWVSARQCSANNMGRFANLLLKSKLRCRYINSYSLTRSFSRRIPVFCLRIRGGSRAAATSKMECFVIIVNCFQPLTIVTKRSILDVAAGQDPPLVLLIWVVKMSWRHIGYNFAK